jgi:uncharacterized membrane protein (UPF0127 family)
VASFRELTIEREDGTVLCDRCVIADNPYARLVGLLGRSELEIGEGLLMRPAFSVHTSFMRFPIDVVFLDRSLKVVGIEQELRPWRAAVKRGAHAVLELPSGESARRDIRLSEQLALVDPPPPPARTNGGGPPDPVRVERIRVAVVSRDRRFLRVASFLLARHGHVVESLRTASDARKFVANGSADVVVLDGSPSLASAARSVRSLQALEPGLGVIVVGEDEQHTSAQSFHVLPKWEAFDAIVSEIERQYVGVNGYP